MSHPAVLRDLRPDEGDLLDALLAGMSPQSRYLRFHSPVPRLTAGMRRVLLDVDGHDKVALVAEDGAGAPIGIARTIRDPLRRTEAELAVAVVDAWHRRGVGRDLVTAVAERALRTGVRRLTARVLPQNAAALGLLRHTFPVCFTRPDDDALVLVAMLGGGDGSAGWDITMDDILADLAA